MKHTVKRVVSGLLCAAMFLGIAACGGGDTQTSTPPAEDSKAPVVESAAPGEKVVYTNGGPQEFFETPWLNPGTYVFNKAVYGHLIVADENLAPIPDHPDAMATYTYSDDGTVLTFTLKDNLYWHNGEKVTAEDVKWSMEFVAKTPVCNAVFQSTFKAIAGSTAADGSFNDTFSGIVVDGQTVHFFILGCHGGKHIGANDHDGTNDQPCQNTQRHIAASLLQNAFRLEEHTRANNDTNDHANRGRKAVFLL